MALRPLGIDRDGLLRALTARGSGLLGTWLDLREGSLRELREPDADGLEARLEAEPDRWVKVPLFHREFRLMSGFVDQVEDDGLAHLLDAALAGPAAFREWERVLAGAPDLGDQWRNHREQALVRWALSWLAGLGVAPTWAPDPPSASVEIPTLLAIAVAPSGSRRQFPSEAAAQAAFARACRDLCELVREPVPSRRALAERTFRRGAVEIARDRREVTIRLRDPDGLG